MMKKTERFVVKLDPDFLEKIKKTADKLKISPSAYARMVLARDVEERQKQD